MAGGFCPSMAAGELLFGSFNWLCPLYWQRRAVLREGFKCQSGLGLGGCLCNGILTAQMCVKVCVLAHMQGHMHIHGCMCKSVCIQSYAYKCRRTISLLVFTASYPFPSLFPPPLPYSLSALCYRWQSNCLWCLAGEPGPAASVCSACGHYSLVPGGLLAPLGLPSDPQSPLFPP